MQGEGGWDGTRRVLSEASDFALMNLAGHCLGTFAVAELFCREPASANAATPISGRSCRGSGSLPVIRTSG